ncbi:MAG TPA: hypothetical protein PKW75_01505 [candidate division Zixibacteria bacterium]|nr:hypothetical protein [candidate division Zixibacteria bacterium]MDD4917788.1 hypothetical protein [candidate division Zixibacteria bacterium]MDM7971881.1 hypothetical protein [candidate division Zixibacteria bacterium]HOD67692.1 hypothetical protein [candidate division Zixibacteria bacterium]HOZ06938.1 hypothetical protein [candidate division Zixibacteria bacterium]
MPRTAHHTPGRATRLLLRAVFTIVLLTVSLAGAASGMVFLRQENLHISNLHRIEEDVYAYSQNMTVDGFVDGELTAFVYSLQINGDVTGSANVLAYQLTHRGHIERSLRGFASTVIIDGSVGRSLLLAANEVTINRAAVVGRDARIYGNNVRLYGTITGNTYVSGSSLIIEGTIEGDLDLRAAKRAEIASTAVITGNLTYRSPSEGDLVIADGATVAGTVTWVPPAEEAKDGEPSPWTAGPILCVAKLLAAFLFGIILVAVFRRHAEESLNQLRARLVVSIAVGFLVLIGFTLAALTFIIALVLVITGLILVSGQGVVLGAFLVIFSTLALPIASFASVSAAIMLYSGKIVVAYLAGALLLKRARPALLSWWNLLLGLVLLFVIFEVPYLGNLVYLLVGVTGAGAIALGVRNCRRPVESPAPAAPSYPPPPTPPPPPPSYPA